jgi:hypothetical protein
VGRRSKNDYGENGRFGIRCYDRRVMTTHHNKAFYYLLLRRQTSKYKFDYSPVSNIVATALFNLRVYSMSNVSIQGKPADFGEDKKRELFHYCLPTPKGNPESGQ